MTAQMERRVRGMAQSLGVDPEAAAIVRPYVETPEAAVDVARRLSAARAPAVDRAAVVKVIHEAARTHTFEAQWAADALIAAGLMQDARQARAEALREFAAEIDSQVSRGHSDLDVAARQVRLVLAGQARQRADRIARGERP